LAKHCFKWKILWQSNKCKCKKHNEHSHAIIECVATLVVHEYDISLIETQTKSNTVNWKRYRENKSQKDYDGLGVWTQFLMDPTHYNLPQTTHIITVPMPTLIHVTNTSQ
jgi:hypothetical protein